MNSLSKLQTQPNSAMQSILLLLAAICIFSIQDVIIKFMSSDYAVLQIVLIRTIFTLPIMWLILHFNGGRKVLVTQNLALQLVRGLMMFLAYLFFFLALAALPFSLTLAIFFSGPLFITALSVPFLKESVGWRRWLAILVGFGGVLFIIRPNEASFNPATIFALLAAFTYAISIIMTHKMNDSAVSMAAYTTAVYLVAAIILSPIFAAIDFNSSHPSLLFLTKSWPTPLLKDVLLISLTSLFWGIGMLLLSSAYRETAVSLLAPFEYFSIFYGIIFGFLFWQEIPTVQMFIGISIIISSGIFIIYRENLVAAE